MEEKISNSLLIKKIEQYIESLLKYNELLHSKYIYTEKYDLKDHNKYYEEQAYYLCRVKEEFEKMDNVEECNNILEYTKKIESVYKTADKYDENTKESILNIIEEITNLKDKLEVKLKES